MAQSNSKKVKALNNSLIQADRNIMHYTIDTGIHVDVYITVDTVHSNIMDCNSRRAISN